MPNPGRRSAAAALVAVAGAIAVAPSPARADSAPAGSVALTDAKVTQKVYLDIASGGQPLGRLELGLFGDDVPITVKNFVGLATGSEGYGYKNCSIHRILKGFVLQGGDFERGDGRGGRSIYGKRFADESFAVRHGRVDGWERTRRAAPASSPPDRPTIPFPSTPPTAPSPFRWPTLGRAPTGLNFSSRWERRRGSTASTSSLGG